MATLILCQDGPDAPALRKEYLRAHLDYMATIAELISVAGPTIGSEQNFDLKQAPDRSTGNCFIYATDELKQARVLFENDPYVLAGVYQSYTVSKLTPAAGQWIGGISW